MGELLKLWLLLAAALNLFFARPTVCQEDGSADDEGSGEIVVNGSLARSVLGEACTPDTCGGNGQCRVAESGNGVECVCDTGFGGERCDLPAPRTWVQCDPYLCNGGTCKIVEGKFSCNCSPGRSGAACNFLAGDPCADLECAAGEICQSEDDQAYCVPIGRSSGRSIGYPCNQDTCYNSGTCFPADNSRGFKCVCERGYFGQRCEGGPSANVCSDDMCSDRGRCSVVLRNIVCDCFQGYSGLHCELGPNFGSDPCLSNPCSNNGHCKNAGRTYDCFCTAGYSGRNCENERLLDPCSSDPCPINRRCVTVDRSYRCACPPGYSGPACRSLQDPCARNPCVNGRCFAIVNTFYCSCISGFYGQRCDARDPCGSSPCQHGGRCLSNSGQATCRCVNGYKGEHCEIPFSACYPDPCENGGQCAEGIDGSYICTCLSGWTGNKCEIESRVLASRSPCNQRQMICMNGGTCTWNGRNAKCVCRPGFSGILCERHSRVDLSSCSRETCVNGRCASDGTQWKCICDGDWTGPRCDVLNPCRTKPCFNGGSCNHVRSNSFSCTCKPGFVGKRCRTRSVSDPCSSSPCLSSQRCVASGRNYRCVTDVCASKPCKNGGICRPVGRRFKCTCVGEFIGTICDKSVSVPAPNPCKTNPCANGGTCHISVQGRNSFSCTCAVGFTGDRCRISSRSNLCHPNPCPSFSRCVVSGRNYQCVTDDVCATQPCKNGGSCLPVGRHFKCTCVGGWTGTTCEDLVPNPCKVNPCANGGTCLSVGRHFKCTCDGGWTGTTCTEFVPNPCKVNPCANGGTCLISVQGRNAFNCACLPGFTGDRCRIRSGVDPCNPFPCLPGSRCVVDGRNFRCVSDVCSSRPCKNGGACQSDGRNFKCTCVDAWTGPVCDVSNPCSTMPCENRGVCNVAVIGENSFTCTCQPGFTGGRCERRSGSNPCQQNSCPSNQRCVPSGWGYRCVMDVCAPAPCKNGGACNPVDATTFKCTCFGRWTGPVCDQPVSNPCRANPCENGGTCHARGKDSFSCTCAPGFMGGRCRIRALSGLCSSNPCPSGLCVEIGGGNYECRARIGRPRASGPCDENPCKNGAVCEAIDTWHFKCTCDGGWIGTVCDQKPPSPCDAEPCMNGGTCKVAALGYNSIVCTCLPGYTGGRCETGPNDPCNPNPCRNYGRCSSVGRQFKCTCDGGWIGTVCDQRPPSPCDAEPCMNGGTCKLASLGYNSIVCTCLPGYTGGRCETGPNDPCNPNPCRNYGRCSSVGGQFKCTCGGGWIGTVCNKRPPNPCDSEPCMNGGACNIAGSNTFVCTCQQGFTGAKCETSDPCSPGPCRNYGTCSAVGRNFRCTCTGGWTGTTCEQKAFNPCTPDPCLNGGTCNLVAGSVDFACICEPEFEGQRCEMRIRSRVCSSNPCLNGGVCVVSDGVRLCLCEERYSGEFCELHPCNPNPCQNEGACQLSGSGFSCTCVGGWRGPVCDIRVRVIVPTEVPLPAPRACAPDPCKNGCSCFPSCRHELGYYCKGRNGSLGKNCDIPAPSVDCGLNVITISIDDRVVEEYGGTMDNSTIFMASGSSILPSPSCPATKRGSYYVIYISRPFATCGTVVSGGRYGSTVVSNKIWMNRLVGGQSADMPIPLLNFVCKYEEEYAVVTSLRPSVFVPPTITSVGNVENAAKVELCKSDTCPAQCPQIYALTRGAVYTVGQKIHLRFTTSTAVAVRLESLFLSCDPSVGSVYNSADLLLARGECLVDGGNRKLPTTVVSHGASICVSFPVPMLTGCSEFYIHARLNPCLANCAAPYRICARRGKRSDPEALEVENAAVQVFGPIFVVKGRPGVAVLMDFDENGTEVVNIRPVQKPTEDVTYDDSVHVPLYIVLGVLTVVAVAMFMVLFGYNWRRINAHCGR